MNRRAVSAFFSGLLFAIGLGVAGMTQPDKVIGFLDFFGAWDPSLMFVMGGAVATYMGLYRWLVKRPKPFLVDAFELPTARAITPRLVVGAALFGVGWGLSGFCPGPALTSVVTGSTDVLIFVVSMSIGMLAFKRADAWWSARQLAAASRPVTQSF